MSVNAMQGAKEGPSEIPRTAEKKDNHLINFLHSQVWRLIQT